MVKSQSGRRSVVLADILSFRKVCAARLLNKMSLEQLFDPAIDRGPGGVEVWLHLGRSGTCCLPINTRIKIMKK